jgi:hypothetical protein
MKIAKVVSLVGAFVMAGGIVWAFITGQFNQEGSLLLSMPWGIVSMVDLYTGFILFSIWIVYREKSRFTALIWVLLMLTLGFFAGSLYVFLAIQKSSGNWQRFWHGTRYSELS